MAYRRVSWDVRAESLRAGDCLELEVVADGKVRRRVVALILNESEWTALTSRGDMEFDEILKSGETLYRSSAMFLFPPWLRNSGRTYCE